MVGLGQQAVTARKLSYYSSILPSQPAPEPLGIQRNSHQQLQGPCACSSQPLGQYRTGVSASRLR